MTYSYYEWTIISMKFAPHIHIHFYIFYFSTIETLHPNSKFIFKNFILNFNFQNWKFRMLFAPQNVFETIFHNVNLKF